MNTHWLAASCTAATLVAIALLVMGLTYSLDTRTIMVGVVAVFVVLAAGFVIGLIHAAWYQYLNDKKDLARMNARPISHISDHDPLRRRY